MSCMWFWILTYAYAYMKSFGYIENFIVKPICISFYRLIGQGDSIYESIYVYMKSALQFKFKLITNSKPKPHFVLWGNIFVNQ